MALSLHLVARIAFLRVGKALAEPSRWPSLFAHSFHVSALAKPWLNICDNHHSSPTALILDTPALAKPWLNLCNGSGHLQHWTWTWTGAAYQ
jgi:hypothetical protein